MRADIAESIRHDVVTDDQYILEVVPFNGERWATDKPMTLEELAAWIGQPDLKTPMSQTLVDALGGWFVYGSDRKELSEDQVQALWCWYTESPVSGSDPDAVTVYDGSVVNDLDEDEDDWDSAALVVHRNPISLHRGNRGRVRPHHSRCFCRHPSQGERLAERPNGGAGC